MTPDQQAQLVALAHQAAAALRVASGRYPQTLADRIESLLAKIATGGAPR